uniref:Uncharacterized protein n=1 Tax=Panagrolaimus sp. JU765 TaxID=591449 RepID=A0AC34RQP1_9BILA
MMNGQRFIGSFEDDLPDDILEEDRWIDLEDAVLTWEDGVLYLEPPPTPTEVAVDDAAAIEATQEAEEGNEQITVAENEEAARNATGREEEAAVVETDEATENAARKAEETTNLGESVRRSGRIKEKTGNQVPADRKRLAEEIQIALKKANAVLELQPTERAIDGNTFEECVETITFQRPFRVFTLKSLDEQRAVFQCKNCMAIQKVLEKVDVVTAEFDRQTRDFTENVRNQQHMCQSKNPEIVKIVKGKKRKGSFFFADDNSKTVYSYSAKNFITTKEFAKRQKN